MKRWFQKSLPLAFTLACLTAGAVEPNQQQCCSPELIGIYFGGFGGWIFPYDVTVAQRGTAFFDDAAGGPLDVEAVGVAPGKTQGFGGLHLGYEWMNEITCWFRLVPAVEVEGVYFTNKRTADVDNPTTRLDAHEFLDTLPMRVGTLLANGILEFNNDYISPYFGAGVGVGFVSIHDADSLQIDPMEAGVNHFNSDPNDFTTTFAVQAKAGLRSTFWTHYRLFAEYRFLYLPRSSYSFGSTRYPTHVPTAPWSVRISPMLFNAVTLGIDFLF